MPNILFNTWVKIVNNTWDNLCISCDSQSTIKTFLLKKQIHGCVKPQLNQLFLQINSTNFYTQTTNKFNLLNKSFTYFPHNLSIELLFKNIKLIHNRIER